MGSTSSFCQQAIAYLKPAMRDEEPALSLSKADSPVLRSINEDLLVTYVVDAGDQFRLVQHRHLEQEGVSTDELHGIAVSNLERLADTPHSQRSSHNGERVLERLLQRRYRAPTKRKRPRS